MRKNKIIMVLTLSILYALPVQAKVKNYVVTSNNKNYVYSLNDLQSSFINYKTGTGDTSLYDKFKIKISEGKFLAFQDERDKYVSYEDVVDIYMQSKIDGSTFSVDKFLENAKEIKLDLDSINVETPDPNTNKQNNTSSSPIINDNTDITNKFTDANLKSAIYKIIEKKSSQSILYSDVKDIKSLDVSNKNISSLSGIEYFKSLEMLKCNDNKLTTLDMSKNVKLNWLECTNNQLKNVDISKNKNLTIVELGSNQLTLLDVSNNQKLFNLSCFRNKLTTLDVSKNEELRSLAVFENKLKFLDISKNKNLSILSCPNNQLTSLDVSNNLKLECLSCQDNQLTTLDVSKNKKLTHLECGNNKLKTLDVTPNTDLWWLQCKGNELTSIDISNNKDITEFQCDNNVNVIETKKAEVGLDNTIKQTVITIPDNITDSTNITSRFTDANLKSAIYKIIEKKSSQSILYSDVKNIKFLDVSNKNISSLSGIEYFKSLEVLECTNNQIRTLDITKNTDLTTAYLGSNKLASLDVSRNIKLNELICSKNELTSLDVSKNINLESLLAYTNKLKNLDVSKNKNLTHLACDENQLTTLDVSKNTELGYLSCSENELTFLDISKNKKLFELHCDDNKLKTLNVTENTDLYWLFCGGNQLTSIDISKNKVLENFRYDDNVTVVK